MENARRKIMIVDDNIANLTVGRNLLKAHYEVYLAPSAAQMFVMLEKIRPDLILLDIEMPETDGYGAITKLKADERFAAVPVVFLTAQSSDESEIKGFDLGAVDYINKPFSPPLLLKRIEHQLLLVKQRETIQYHVDNLSVMVSEKVSEIIALQNAILATVADLVEFRDRFTGGHIARTQLYLKAIIDGLVDKGLYADKMAGWDMEYILQSAQLHDVGKISIPDAILNKPARLTTDEFETMKTHVAVGIDAVSRIISKTKSHAFLGHALNIVGAHHERWDGSGYPNGLKGEEIPLEGRLMAIADVYDALVSWRPYKKELSHEEAMEIIIGGSGTHFDPVLVDVFRTAQEAFRQIAAGKPQDENPEWGLVTLPRDMEVGIPLIDAQHRALISHLNRLAAMGDGSASKEEARGMLDFLGAYIEKHFSDEEQLQRQADYPKYEQHRREHEAFTDTYRKMKADFSGGGFSHDFLRELNKTVIDWISTHIKTVDVEFGKYYQLRGTLMNGEAQAAAVAQ